MPGADPVLRIDRLVKAYAGLRPLRMADLTVMPGERVALTGIDAGGAELLVNLVTGASVPDEGEVRTLGRRTTDIANADEWLVWLEAFGIVSERGVLLEESTLQQNMALPFSLDIESIPPEIAARVRALAEECGIAPHHLERPAGALPPEVRARAHLARAVALSPRLLIAEHPTAKIPEPARAALAQDMVRVCDARQLPALIVTNDEPFARAIASRALALEGATGRLRPLRKRLFG